MKKSQHKKVVKVKKTAKSKIWIRAEKLEASWAENLSSQSGLFLNSKARKAFTKLRQAFVKAPILNHFDPERHIQIETDTSSYAIGGIFSQLTLDDLVQWHPIAFFSRKMIPTETQYEIHNGKLLAIVEAFKTWRHYLEDCKHEVLVFTNHNNLQRFMDTKSLSSRQVRWAQKLSKYHFWIDYQQGKANRAVDTLSQYPNGVLRKKKHSEPRIRRFYTDCSPCWLEYPNWPSREWAVWR